MTVIAKNKKDGKTHIFLKVEKIEFYDEFYNDKDAALLSKTEEIYLDGGKRSIAKALNENYKLIQIQESFEKEEEIFEELAKKDKFIIHKKLK